MTTIGSHAHAISERGERADVSALDTLAAIKHIGPLEVTWETLNDFAFSTSHATWQQPFHTEIPRLPLAKRKRAHYATVEDVVEGDREDQAARPSHIPAHLPPFPPRRTYEVSRTSSLSRDIRPDLVRKARVKRKQDIANALTDMTDAPPAGSSHFGDEGGTSKVESSAAPKANGTEPTPFAFKPMSLDPV